MNQIIAKTITAQVDQQAQLAYQKKKDNGIFFTNELKIIDSILDIVEFNNGILGKKILEPAIGNGIFYYERSRGFMNTILIKKKLKNLLKMVFIL